MLCHNPSFRKLPNIPAVGLHCCYMAGSVCLDRMWVRPRRWCDRDKVQGNSHHAVAKLLSSREWCLVIAIINLRNPTHEGGSCC
jgi:hypothetical protein